MGRSADRVRSRFLRRPRPVRYRPRVSPRIRNPRGHWWLLTICMLVLLIVVVFQGFATHTVGLSAEPHRSGGHAPLAHARPILAARGGSRLVGVEPPPGRAIALTFDDGPSQKWTPKIAAALRAAGVHATFFVIGSQAARYPDIIRRLVRDGDEIGNHTFTH